MLLILLMIGFIFQSCSKDDSTESEDFAIGTALGQGGKNGNDNNNNENVAFIDNDIVEDWTELFLELDRYATGMRPNATARALAYIYLASYETALPGMRDYVSQAERLNGLKIDRSKKPRRLDFELALNACFARVMDHFILHLPTEQRNKIEVLRLQNEGVLSNDLRPDLVQDSKEWGEYVARQIIKYSETDVEAESQILEPQPLSYEPPTGDGYWTYSADPERALFPYWESARTFVVSPDQTTTVPPTSYNEDPNSDYFQQMMEVYTVNNTAMADDNEDLWIAEFWSDDAEGVVFSPPARQFSIGNQLIDQYEMNLERTLGFYLKLGFALNDAAVSTWKYKYEYMVMRPSVFIHEFIDPDFQTNLYRILYWPNPGFPGYPSGHSAFASAAGGIFIDYFGDQTNFTDISHEGRTEFRGAPRTFDTFSEMARENAFSRIPLGVHIEMDCTEGLRLGYEISDGLNDLKIKRFPG